MDTTPTDIKNPSVIPETNPKTPEANQEIPEALEELAEDTALPSVPAETSAAPEKEQFRKIDLLLHSEQKAKRLIGVMSLYGRIYYDWHLDTDLIDWRGPIQQLIRSIRGIISGDIFLRRLNQQDFNQRMTLLEETRRTRKTFHTTYHLNITDNIYCRIEEYAEMLFTKDGKPIKMLGAIEVKPTALVLKNDGLLDVQSEEGILTRLQLIEKLDKDIESSRENNTYGAFVAVTIDRLTDIGISYGKQGVDKINRFVLEKIKNTIRQYDSIGILGGNSFGLILYNCDRWGIVSATERLLNITHGQKIDMNGSHIEVSISAGGAIFPCEDMNAQALLAEAEVALTDALNTKSAARFWKPSMDAAMTPPPTTNTNREKGKRRMTDNPVESSLPEKSQESIASDKTVVPSS